jgi:membrane glycosyltransferase
MTVNTRVIKMILAHNSLPYVQIHEGLRLQVIADIDALPHCQKHQSAAFVTATQSLIVWEDDPRKLLDRAQFIQDSLMKIIWGADAVSRSHDEKDPKGNVYEWETVDEDAQIEKRRPLMFIQAFLTACTVALCLTAIGTGWRHVVIEMNQDPQWLRMAFIGCVVPQFWLGLFFFQALMGNLAQMFGPTSQVKKNSKFYSGKAPRRLHREGRTSLPHVTIQMPVYKEGLKHVIEPTILSVKAAISTYELQGGTANIFINDDGMQSMGEEIAKARQDFYDEHNIGWVARPNHNPNPQHPGELAFTRRGKFKKASNMNYGLWVSGKAEEMLIGLERHDEWTQRDEDFAYGQAVKAVLEENDGEAWADGNIRVGDYILLIDSDTRVPEDCLLEAVSEMEQSPQVAIIQYASGVMNVTDSFFEKGITFFTNLIYTQIQFSVANGDVAPFVGHNAVLRWRAMQEIAYDCPLDKREKYWSEETVSEDFDMALRLQTAGYLVRLASYKNKGYKEGVSLTVYDELARWEKYDNP